MKFEKLYDIAFPLSDDKQSLYFQGQYNQSDDKIIINKNEIIDIGTYFNSISIKKWISYTSITKIKVSLKLVGNFFVDFYGINIGGEEEVLRVKCEGSIEQTFNTADFNDFDLIGIRMTALSDKSMFFGGQYFGIFETEREVKMGITICTFNREQYLLPNLDTLKQLTDRNPNINVMVIDNGRTLAEQNTPSLQIIHNPNFGGSGGFARGMIEQVSQNKNTHIILMDDDIIIELSSLDRLYCILKHLKSEHFEKFFAGAMLRLNEPTIQHENTAYWNEIISCPFGKGFNLADKRVLCINESISSNINQYAGWWFCCIPINVVKKIGYPLPIFIKGDDVEYGIRNHNDILTMNGVGVWHEIFAKKVNPVIKYFNDRNMFLVHHFASVFGRLTIMATILLKIVKRIVNKDWNSIRMMEPAIKDLNEGLIKMTAIASDKKFASLKNYPLNKNIVLSIISIIKLGIEHCINYDKLDKEYKNFRSENLLDQKFWRRYLNI